MNLKHQLTGFLFLVAASAFCQELQTAGPDKAGFSSGRLELIDGMIENYVEHKKVAGAVALIARDGKIVYHKGIGYSDIKEKKKMQPNTIFRIASQTKAITSVAVMMLYEEGKLLLDDPVSRYISEFKEAGVLDKFNAADSTYTTVPAEREVTIRHLLTHTSGISYAVIGSKEGKAIYAKAGVPAGFVAGPLKLADKIKILGGLPLMHQPGERFTYGLNTDVLGYVVEVVSGMSLDRFFHERIFEPLQMNDTYFYLPKDKQDRLAEVYVENEAGETVEAPQVSHGEINKDYPLLGSTYFSGGAGLSSTARDYSVFLQMLLNGGEYNGKRLLSPDTVRLMTVNQIGEKSLNHGNKFGLGFEVVTEEGSAAFPWHKGSFSWGGYFGSHYWADPVSGVVAVILTQETPNSEWGEISAKFKNMVYSALVE
ncbi:serine hydrolase domain-containing protein [Sinomicrobium weinanense]|uniref:Beta-lactamase family protein n=1 Tax=Sinomicrobium weinanense TaxID=2842200 RepID=A0A926JSI3_9FLAO|nr:serine hydrolase domain-containing protein [Sinomicrobium weinanense]MBC9796678.1 beta-lactamase family protein [Sinomicrobium weinanense]MBU3124928.1 beta-lactamase family protein [Sinomicrobium weinanense]